MSALGQGFHDQQQLLLLYKERYEKLKRLVMDEYYTHLTDWEFDNLVDNQKTLREVEGYPV
jgi:hypothetical protein